MDRGLEIKDTTFLSPSLQPYWLFQPPPPPPPLSSSQSSGFNLNNRVSPSILIIIIILAVIFFISGLLHLLVRFLLRPPNRNPDEIDNLTALQGQLQQLFHLHDSGVDQSFIDTLPLFNYKAIIGVKDPFDCAVCLCEFEGEDKLRLLPNCSHAFHMDCIDTWLLSHSTCPLCRASLVAAFSQNSHCSPVVMVLESGSESSQEIGSDREAESGGGNSVGRVNSHLSTHYGDDDSALSCGDPVLKCGETEVRERENSGEKVMSVKLGKCRNVGGGDEGSSEINAEARRCFSMGSFAYVMDEHSSLKVFITTPMKKQSSKKPSLPLRPGHRVAMSECGCDSRREFNGIEAFKILETDQSGGNDNKSIVGSKRDSFSVSKIWLRGRKDKPNAARMESSRRAVSFRFPMHRNPVAAGELDTKNGGSGGDPGTRPEIEISRLENGGRELDFEEEMEVQRCNSLDCEGDHSSFGRRTLLWLTGRQNKVVRSSFSSNV